MNYLRSIGRIYILCNPIYEIPDSLRKIEMEERGESSNHTSLI